MSRDVAQDVQLSLLATRVIKNRVAAKKEPVIVKENGMVATGYWVNDVFHIEISKERQ
jgi:hypothetical protein